MIKKIYIIWWWGYTKINNKYKELESDFLSWKTKNNAYWLMITKKFIDVYGKDNVINCMIKWEWEYKNILRYKWYYKKSRRLLRELRKNRKNALFIFHWMYPKILLYALIQSKHKARRRHAIIWPYNRSESKLKWIIFYLIQNIFQRFMNTIFCVNNTEKKELVRYWYKGNKHFLPIPINIDFRKINRKSNKKTENITISCTWSICKRKNQIIIIEAAIIIKNINPKIKITINLMWPEIDNHWEEIRKLIKDTWISDIHLKGQMAADKIKNVYKNTDIYIQPSFAEWLCQTYIEAWISWCPLILSDIPTFKDTVKDFALFFDPRESKDLAEKILRMMKLLENKQNKTWELQKYFNNRWYKSFNDQLNSFISSKL